MRIYLVNFKQCLKITYYVASGLFFNRNKDLALHSFYLFFFTLLFLLLFFLYNLSKRDKQFHSVYIKLFPYSSLSEFETQADNLHLSFFSSS